ncbi:MAG: hypothetical protein ACLPXW_21320 [Xanthobacteraceae bacterium]
MGSEQKQNEFAADGDDLARCMCPQCDQSGIFGYRDQDGRLIWYCNQHRLAQFWADARMPSPLADQSNEGVWFCNTCNTQIKRNDQSC